MTLAAFATGSTSIEVFTVLRPDFRFAADQDITLSQGGICPIWVKLRSRRSQSRGPVYPRKQTQLGHRGSPKGAKGRHAPCAYEGDDGGLSQRWRICSLNWNFQLFGYERANDRRDSANETPIVSKRKQRLDLEVVSNQKPERGSVSDNS